MAGGISYDESGSLASYFGVTCLAFILIPATYWTLRPTRRDPHKQLCDCSECRANNKRKASLKSAAYKRKLLRRILPLAMGWAFFAWLVYGLYTAPPSPEMAVYDPFEILGIRSSATEREIKKHYKKLSLQFHPDKVKLGENETLTDIENKYVGLTKAYKSLTDEVTRENLQKYGNPDGPQQREDKIAIPKWVVEGTSSMYVLAAYGIVLGLGIPYVVGSWWFRQRRLTRDGVLNSTAEIFFHQLRDDTDFLSLISLLASALEFVPILAPKRKLSKKDRKERQARIEELEAQLDKKREALFVDESPTMNTDSRVFVTSAVARRARALIWAHLLRVDVPKDMQAEQLQVLQATGPLLNGLANIALAHNWLKTSLLCERLQPAIVQAIPIGASPLAQLPGISLEAAQELEITSGAEGRRWVEKWIKADDKEYTEANKVAKAFPRLEVTNAEFKVQGEKTVTPGSIVRAEVKLRWTYPQVSEANGSARADSVDVVDEKLAVKPARSSSLPPKKESKVHRPTGYAHAPHWPSNRTPGFHMMLGDSKLNKVIVQPQRIPDVPMPNADGTPSEPEEFVLEFQAPPQPNLYSFVLYLVSDTFVGADVAKPMLLKVEAPTDEDSDDDDISEPDEDSLAGQMALLRGEKVRPSGVHGDSKGGDESEYETDTSSDEDEGPRRGRAINEDTDSDSD